MKKVELLSPAGNIECLKAAIEAGCDAIYLAGNMFGARSFAGNFSREELVEAVRYSHLYGVKVYVTVNTIIYEREVDTFIDFIRFIHKISVDAVIIQDLGMLDLVRKKFPNLEIHASTQMHIHNYDGALFAKKMGIKRVVMARETPISLIGKIKKELDIEVEVFVHGALCISYSGECLMSSLIGNRSGNRGTCAQVCRKSYDLYDENKNKLNKDKYLISTKDLCTINYLDKIINSGVDSLKIEGRMKRPEYVYLVTKIYRKVIDNYYATGTLNVNDNDIIELKKIFNRSFTKGFMLGEENDKFVYQKRPNHIGINLGKVLEYKNNYIKIKLEDELLINDGIRVLDEKEDTGFIVTKMWDKKGSVNHAYKGSIVNIKCDKKVKNNSVVLLTSSSKQIKNINLELKNLKRKVPVDVKVIARENEKLLISVTDGQNCVNLSSDFLIQKAINNPTKKMNIINQIGKMGNTVYALRNIDVALDNNIFINLKDINELRRKALLILDEKRLYKTHFVEKDYYITVPDFEEVKKKSILLNNIDEYNLYKNSYDKIYTTNINLLNYPKVSLKLPRVISNYPKLDNNVLIGEVGGLLKYSNFETDFSFNVVNSYTVSFLHSMGAKKVTLSYELTLEQINLIIKKYEKRYKKHPNLELITNSYPEAMITKFDLNKMYGIKTGYLKDEFANEYKLVSSDDFMTIYNFKKVKFDDPDKCYEIGINYLRMNL